MTDHVTIATWIVLDDPETATEFPSVGENSSSSAFQLTYWRCLGVFFLTARVHNPGVILVLYSNVDVWTAAPPTIYAVLVSLGVACRKLAITYRLPTGSVSRWGNQFYVLDIIQDFAATGAGALVLTDSDCVWRRPVTRLASDVFSAGCLLYTLAPGDQKDYEIGRSMNGMTHARMAEIAVAEFDLPVDHKVQYHGGEFFAATQAFCQTIRPRFDDLWRRARSEAAWPDSIKEEAHFLSILCEGIGVAAGGANPFVRRIWTNFEDMNADPADLDLTIWHLPAEKRFGTRRLWRFIETSQPEWASVVPTHLNLVTARFMGVPTRGLRKLALDIVEKCSHKYIEILEAVAHVGGSGHRMPTRRDGTAAVRRMQNWYKRQGF